IGGVAGLVVMGVLFAPYMRKFGAYTVPSFIGRRMQSRGLRVLCAAILIVPTFLLLLAELSLAVWVARKFTGSNERWMLAALLLTVGIPLIAGGMRAVTWSSTAQAIAVMFAVVVGVGVLGAWFTNLPVPQLSIGPTLQGIAATEHAYAIPSIERAPLESALPGAAPVPMTERLSEPFTALGSATFSFTILTLLAGLAAAPWLLPRCSSATSVHAARKTLSWAVLVFGFVMVTASAGAVLLKFVVLSDVVGQGPASLPQWFERFVGIGLASASTNLPELPPAAVAIHRDAVAIMLPAAAELPETLTHLAYVGVLAAALAAIQATAFALAAMLSEDVMFGTRWEPPPRAVRLLVARLAVVGIIVLAAFGSAVTRSDPLVILLWAMVLSASTAFPVMLLAVWYKRLTAPAAAMTLIFGFSTAVVVVIATELLGFDLPIVIATPLGIVTALAAGILTTQFTGRPARVAIEHVRDMRIPGGETIVDRELRLLRLKENG
ncbi:MAG: sodium:solute symporter, partial [Pseudomonadota bacterium]